MFFQKNFPSNSEESKFLEGKFVEIKILDKVSSKSSLLKIKIGKEKKYLFRLIKKQDHLKILSENRFLI